MTTVKDTLLISEDYIKSRTNIDWNLSGRFVLPAVKTAQNIDLREIIGECLLTTLQQLVYDKTIDDPENEDYKELLEDYVQHYLCAQVISEVIIPISYKIANGGLMQYSDDKLDHSSNTEINLIREYYQNKANVYKRRLQEYLCKNKSKFPDVENCCSGNLYSAETSGLWLGGYRSKIVKKGCCGRD